MMKLSKFVFTEMVVIVDNSPCELFCIRIRNTIIYFPEVKLYIYVFIPIFQQLEVNTCSSALDDHSNVKKRVPL